MDSEPKPETAEPRRMPWHGGFPGVGVLVCGAGAVVGWLFGSLAPLTYRYAPSQGGGWNPWVFVAGVILGISGGLLAGMDWCRKVLPLARSGGGEKGWVGRGILWGGRVGIRCAVLLHVGLAIVSLLVGIPLFPGALVGVTIGLVAGAVAGLLTGIVCVGLAGIAVAMAERDSC